MPKKLVSTTKAATAVGVDRSSLWRYMAAGWLKPHGRTAGGPAGRGHLRWDVERLSREIAEHNAATTPAEDPVTTYTPEPTSAPEHQPVVVAVVTSYLGVVLEWRRDGKPPVTFVAGEIEPGESPADAAIREVKEETTLRVVAGRRELGRRVHPVTGRTMVYIACQPADAGLRLFVGDADELTEVRWARLDELTELIPAAHIYPPVLDHLERVLA